MGKSGMIARATIQVHAPVNKVWDALTRPELVKKYFFGTDLHTDWKPGSKIRFTGEWQGTKYEDKGTVISYEAQKSLSYDYWSSMSGTEDKPENYVTLQYRVHDAGNGNTEVEILQDARDEKSRDHSQQNWQNVLKAMKEMVESQ